MRRGSRKARISQIVGIAALSASLIEVSARVAGAAALPPGAFVLAAERTPERSPSRQTSYEWVRDVRERLETLESHAADSARARVRSEVIFDPSGRSHPLPPEAGDGRPR